VLKFLHQADNMGALLEVLRDSIKRRNPLHSHIPRDVMEDTKSGSPYDSHPSVLAATALLLESFSRTRGCGERLSTDTSGDQLVGEYYKDILNKAGLSNTPGGLTLLEEIFKNETELSAIESSALDTRAAMEWLLTEVYPKMKEFQTRPDIYVKMTLRYLEHKHILSTENCNLLSVLTRGKSLEQLFTEVRSSISTYGSPSKQQKRPLPTHAYGPPHPTNPRKESIQETCWAFVEKGWCKWGDRCKFSHEKTSEKLTCRHFKEGTCSKGDSCRWSHTADPEHKSGRSEISRQRRPQERRENSPRRERRSRSRTNSRSPEKRPKRDRGGGERQRSPSKSGRHLNQH
jgi:hypothetical protein